VLARHPAGEELGAMSRRARLVGVLLAAVVVSACAGPLRGMKEGPGAQDAAPAPGKAAIVFMRPSGMGYAIASSVFELRPEGDVFIGHVPAKKKLVHHVAPGPVRFMVVSEAADFMQADLEAGKTYYALVTPRMGMWRARFSLRPVHASELGGAELKEWLEECTWVETTDEARDWARRNAGSVQEKKAEYLQKWEPRADKPTLNAADGR
jgi:hypothetical protein